MIEKMLVVSYYANESGLACSHHIDDRLYHLTEAGVDVTLLSSVCAPTSPIVRNMRVPSVLPGGVRFEIKKRLRRLKLPRWRYNLQGNMGLLPVLPFYYLERLLLRVDTTWSWYPAAALAGTFLARRRAPGVIYTTGGPISAHLAGWHISSQTGIPWIAEFQDPLIHPHCARGEMEMRLTKWAERVICENAARVVFLTDEARRQAAFRTSLGDRGVVIYPGARPEKVPLSPYRASDQLHFSHFGSLGGVRNLGHFLSALALCLDREPALRKVMRVDLYGGVARDILQQISGFPYPEIVTMHGMVSRERSVELMKTTDVLLLVQGADGLSRETIPSKAYEYFQASRPILGLVHDNPELERMLRRLGHIPVSAGDPASIMTGIEECLNLWRDSRLATPLERSPYTVEAAAAQLLELSDMVQQRAMPAWRVSHG